jgi:RNA polymerase sigma-70 factor (ECF subfamily)
MAGVGRDERSWIRAAQAGSVGDFEQLFRAHWSGAYRAAYLVVHDHGAAEDIAQESFLAAVRSLERFDADRPFGPWLHRIVVNRSIDWARGRIARHEVAGESFLELTDPLAWSTEQPYAGSGAKAIAAGLAALPPEQRGVIVLRYLLDYTPGEIAELLEIPRGTVNSRLRRGLDALQAYHGGESGERP